jgi:hypothetical protein
MVIEHPEFPPGIHHALGFLPLPEDERGEAEWEDVAYWVKDKADKPRAPRKSLEVKGTAAKSRPARVSRSTSPTKGSGSGGSRV